MLKGHPKGLLVAFFANMGERFGFYTMMAILVLFLQAKYGLSVEEAGGIYSNFYFMIYALALLGGVIADRTQKYKEHLLKGLRAKGISVVAAYGNAVTDIDAYLGAGLDVGRVFIVGPHRGEGGTVPIEDYPAHLKELTPAPK